MGILKTLTSEYFNESIRDEEGKVFTIDGKKYIIKYEDHEFVKDLMPIGDSFFIKKKFRFFKEAMYLCYTRYDSKHFTSFDYFIIPESKLKSVKNNTIKEIYHWLSTYYDIFSDDFPTFEMLEEISKNKDFGFIKMLELKIDKNENCYTLSDGDNYDIVIFDDKEKAIEDEIDYRRDKLESAGYYSSMDSDVVESYKKEYGNDWIDYNSIKNWFEDNFKSKYESYKSDDGKHGCKLYDELIEKDLILDNTSYFDVDRDKPKFKLEDYREKLIDCIMNDDEISRDEAIKKVDGFEDYMYISYLIDYDLVDEDEDYFEIDYDSPKFDVDDKIEEIVNESMNDIDDFEKKFMSDKGYLDGDFYDLEKLAKKIVEKRGIQSEIKDDDGNTKNICITIDNKDYFLYVRQS